MNSEATKQRIMELFEAALRESPAERAEFLRRACGDNEKLWAEVSSLVAAHERLGDTSQPATVRAGEAAGAIELKRIGRYEIGCELGRGGMGIVFEAHDPLIGRTVALKTIPLDGYRTAAEREWLREHLFREARSAGALSHPNLVTIHDSGVEGDLAFIAMERLDGPTLQQRLIAGERLEREEAVGILRQAAGALDYAHQAGVVHRDIKPSNIMFHRKCQQGATVKITDFGIAKITGAELPTRTGMPAGTPNYMSPEQIQGHAVDGRSDQFSLAVVAFEMLTARKAFPAESLVTVVHEIVYGERPSARAVVAELPSAVDEVFNRGLAKDSRDRYQTCAEFVTALDAAFTTPEPRVEPLRRRRWHWIAAAAAVMLLVVAWFASRRPPQGQAVLNRDFEKLGLKAEAYLDNRPGWPHRDDHTWQYVPAQVGGLSGVVQMAGGWEHSLVLKSDGTVWAWGNNGSGRLGDGTTKDRPTPIQIGSRAVGFVTLAAGGHSLAIKNDGSVWAWGGNPDFELGDGTATDRWTPVQVRGLSGVVSVAAGGWHNLALKNDGSVWSWGLNDHMQLGDGTKTNNRTPVRINGLSGVAAISAGNLHSLAVKRDGSVWAWGFNENGRLGDGTTTDRSTPVQVHGISGVMAIAVGSHHNLALKNDGSVWAWGQNGFGEVGDGTTTDRWLPVQVTGISGVTAIAAGANHSFVLKSDGTVWAWGQNDYGALGDGTTKDRWTPVQATGLSGVAAIAAGGQHCLARKGDGSLWTWGSNDFGKLGREATQPLDYAGSLTQGGFPRVQFDRKLHKIFLHPGRSSTYQWAASLGFPVASDRQYDVSGVFQRTITSPGPGYEVEVAVILGTDAAHPLWDQRLGRLEGGRKTFHIRKPLLRGQVLRFVVFSGPEGRDESRDGTSLQATVAW